MEHDPLTNIIAIYGPVFFVSFCCVRKHRAQRELSVRGEAGRSGEGFSGSLKVEVVSREYEALLGRQLQEQQRWKNENKSIFRDQSKG